MKRKFSALAATVAVAVIALLGVTAAPAQAADNDRLNLYVNTWFNGIYGSYSVPTTCTSMGGSIYDNNTESVMNWANYAIRVYKTYNCSGDWLEFGANSGATTLTNLNNFDNAISSYRRVGV